MSIGHVPSIGIAGVAELIADLGQDPVAIAIESGIPPEALVDRDIPIPGERVVALFELAATRCGVRDFALRLARRQGLHVLGPLWTVIRSAPSVRVAMQDLAANFDFHTSAAQVRVDEEPQSVAICYDTRVRAPAQDVQTIELGLGILCLALRSMLGPDWRPVAVQFRHAPPPDARPHRALFGDLTLFDQDRNALVLDYTAYAAPLRAGSGRTHTILARALAAKAPSRAGDTVRVELMIRALLPDTLVDLAAVARELGLPARTLQHRLTQEGTSFQQILDRVRLELAEKYLTGSSLRLGQIAEILRFADSSAFSRFVRLKTGRPPSQIRAEGPAI